MKTKNRSLAYYDSYSGLISCKVMAIKDDMIIAIVTTNRGAYKKNEVIESIPRYVVPRLCVHVRSGHYKINSNYKWYVNHNGLIDFDNTIL